MAGTTNFQQWNPGIENQQTDAEYTADTQRSGGAVAGVFPSTTANKLFFQLSSMVTALATMMANKGYTVEDGSAGTSGHNFAALVAVLTNLVTAVDQQKCKFVYVAGGGTVNDYTAIYSPAVPALTDGLLLGFKAANTNTGHSIFCPQGLTAKPIYGLGHVFLQGGEIVANSAVWVMYNASLNSGSGGWVLLNASGGGLQVANPTQSYHALNRLTGDARYQPLDSDLTAIAAIVGQRGDIIYYGPSGWTRLGKGTSGQFLSIGANDPAWAALNMAGRLLNIQVITSTGTYTPTSGTNSVLVKMIGGGGPGGSIPASGTSFATSGGGGAGAYAEGYFTSGFSGVTVTIGAAGTAAAGSAGSNGGTTSFGSLMSAPGGNAGLLGTLTSPSASCVNSGGQHSSNPTGWNIVGHAGAGGDYGIFIADSTQHLSGSGANSPLGIGGRYMGDGDAAQAARGYGSGGAGVCRPPGYAAVAGGNGAPGLVIVYEFA